MYTVLVHTVYRLLQDQCNGNGSISKERRLNSGVWISHSDLTNIFSEVLTQKAV